MRPHASLLPLAIHAVPTRTLTWLLVVFAAQATRSETAGYQPREGQQFGYEIKADADRGTHIDKLSGTIIYTVKSVADGKFTLAWTSHVRVQEAPERPDAAAGLRGQPSGLCLRQAEMARSKSNSQGDIVSTQGAAHLSYLLGDAALLMIEKLPETGRESWKVESSVTLAESGERLPGPPPAGR